MGLNSFPSACPVNSHVSCLYCQLTFSTGPLPALIYVRLISCFFCSLCVLIWILLFFSKLIRLSTEFSSLLLVVRAVRGYPQFLSLAPFNLSVRKGKSVLCWVSHNALSLQKDPSPSKVSYPPYLKSQLIWDLNTLITYEKSFTEAH